MDKLKYICFDYFNTLVVADESFELIKKWMYQKAEYLNLENQKKLYRRFLKNYVYLLNYGGIFNGRELMLRAFRPEIPILVQESLCKEFSDFLFDLFSNSPQRNGAADIVRNLRENYKVGIISNADNDIIQSSISKQGFKFDFIVTSESAKSYKPNIGIFNYFLDNYNAKVEECVMIGDSLQEDIIAADRIGMKGIWLNYRNTNIRNVPSNLMGIVSSLHEFETYI